MWGWLFSSHSATNIWEDTVSLWLCIMWNVLLPRPLCLCRCRANCPGMHQKHFITSLYVWSVLQLQLLFAILMIVCHTMLGYFVGFWCHFSLPYFHFLFWEPPLHRSPAHYQLSVNNTRQCYMLLYATTVKQHFNTRLHSNGRRVTEALSTINTRFSVNIFSLKCRKCNMLSINKYSLFIGCWKKQCVLWNPSSNEISDLK